MLALLLVSCSKKDNNSILYYDQYFPLDLNSWVEYSVVEINHQDIGSDTLNYQLKEVLTEMFLDDEGRQSYRIERFWRTSNSGPWTIKDVWVANKTKTTAERVEENIRYSKMIFPVSRSKFWDGNAKNSLTEWEYYYDSIHVSKVYNQLVFDSTVKVVQRDNINFVENEQAEEVYAKNIGLVYKKLIDYDVTISGKEGVEFEMVVIAYGK